MKSSLESLINVPKSKGHSLRVGLSRILPTLDNLRNFLLTPATETLSFLAAVDISLNANRTTAGYV
jgi:hypothetical protein